MGGRSEIPGAPELPLGFFYRIRRNCAGPIVEIRRERFIGSTWVNHSYILVDRPGLHEAAVRAACQRAFEKFNTRHLEAAAEAEVLDHFRGDYRREVS